MQSFITQARLFMLGWLVISAVMTVAQWKECCKFYAVQRQRQADLPGLRQAPQTSYVTQFSLLTNILRFWSNIQTIQVIIFVETAFGLNNFVLFVMCCAIGTCGMVQLDAQLRVIACDNFVDPAQQRAWANRCVLLVVFVTLMSSLFLESVYMSGTALFFLMGCQFLP